MQRSFFAASAAGVSLAVLFGACTTARIAQSSSATTGTGGAGATTTGISTSSGAGGQIQVGPDASGNTTCDATTDAPPLVPGLFDCLGCLCDGHTHYCHIVHGGAPNPPGPPPEPPCSDDAGPTACTALPSSCLAAPSCACVCTPYPCSCKEVNGGVVVTCNYP